MTQISHLIALFTGLLYLLITLMLISFFWNKLFPSLVMFMLPSVMTAIFLAFPSIYKIPTIDLQEPKIRKAFADKHRIRLQIPIDQNDPILIEHKMPFRRFSAEHAEILYLLLEKHMQKLDDRTKQLAYIASWKANHSRLTENSVVGTLAAVCVGFGLDRILTLLETRLGEQEETIFVLSCILVITCLAFVWKDSRLQRRFYDLIIEDIKAKIEK